MPDRKSFDLASRFLNMKNTAGAGMPQAPIGGTPSKRARATPTAPVRATQPKGPVPVFGQPVGTALGPDQSMARGGLIPAETWVGMDSQTRMDWARQQVQRMMAKAAPIRAGVGGVGTAPSADQFVAWARANPDQAWALFNPQGQPIPAGVDATNLLARSAAAYFAANPQRAASAMSPQTGGFPGGMPPMSFMPPIVAGGGYRGAR